MLGVFAHKVCTGSASFPVINVQVKTNSFVRFALNDSTLLRMIDSNDHCSVTIFSESNLWLKFRFLLLKENWRKNTHPQD